MDGSFQEVVDRLDLLVPNPRMHVSEMSAEQTLQLTIETASRIGIKSEDLDRLSIIHVTGTKGKGSTCATSESILRRQGFKTGFFSSPHLIDIRERIRIQGSPLSHEAFRSYFWQCYNKLYSSKDEFRGYMPQQFKFFTVLAFHVFLEEQVDVVILEVGVGGEYDPTNIISNPVVCGVTSLDIDHVSLLGDSLEKIAWQKGGIFKSGAPALTVQQSDGAMNVLQQRASEKGCPLSVVPSSIYSYDWGGAAETLGIPGKNQELNASLAVQLCSAWTKLHDKRIPMRKAIHKDVENGTTPKADYLSTFRLSATVIEGLQKCYWPGRCQTIKHPGITYYVDGAHTPRSVTSTAHWFTEVATAEARSLAGKTVKVLIFNTTGDRKVDSLLCHLMSCQFDCVVFCPNITTTIEDKLTTDQTNFTSISSLMLSKCLENQKIYERILIDGNQEKQVHSSSGNSNPDVRTAIHNKDIMPCSMSFGCMLEALHWVTQGRAEALPEIPHNVEESITICSADHIQVLCTGSLHLVGGILGIIHPDVLEGCE